MAPLAHVGAAPPCREVAALLRLGRPLDPARGGAAVVAPQKNARDLFAFRVPQNTLEAAFLSPSQSVSAGSLDGDSIWAIPTLAQDDTVVIWAAPGCADRKGKAWRQWLAHATAEGVDVLLTQTGMFELISPASSMNLVWTPYSRAFQVR